MQLSTTVSWCPHVPQSPRAEINTQIALFKVSSSESKNHNSKHASIMELPSWLPSPTRHVMHDILRAVARGSLLNRETYPYPVAPEKKRKTD